MAHGSEAAVRFVSRSSEFPRSGPPAASALKLAAAAPSSLPEALRGDFAPKPLGSSTKEPGPYAWLNDTAVVGKGMLDLAAGTQSYAFYVLR